MLEKMNVFKSKISGFLISVLTFSTVLAQKDLVISGGNTVSSLVCANQKVYVWGSNANGQLGLPGTGNISVPTPMPTGTFNGKDIQQVNSGSGSHFVALDCEGTVWAWGGNADGQVGNGTTGGYVTTPVQVNADPEIRAANRSATNKLINASVVYSGTSNTFAILEDGRLVSWGKNDNTGGTFCAGCQAGQLGHGTQTSTNVAKYVRINANTILEGVVQIFAGDNVAYALVDPDGDGVGTVYSWGQGVNGTLGRNQNGTGNPSSNAEVISPYAMPVYYANGTPMNNIKQLQAGDVFGIALDVNGYVWTWGNGGWNNATGNTTINYTGSDPRRVIAGTTTGASNDGTYLLAKAIGGGQGYGMAVTVDGKPVAWGGTGLCTDGGMTGTGTTTAAIPPTYIQYGPNQVHNNVTLINRGDTWGFYGTSNNEFYAWGCNTYGQLGIGNTVDQTRAVKITPPTGCGFRDPFPFLDLNVRDTSVCQSKFNGVLLRSGFVTTTALDKSYQIVWYKDGVSVKGNPNSTMATEQGVSVNGSYTATTNGKFKVVIKYIGNNGGCVEYPIVSDSMTISYFPQTFTVPTNLTYCGDTVKPRVIPNTSAKPNSVYNYYTTATATTPIVDTTIGSGLGSFLLSKYPGITKDPDGTLHLFVEEKGYVSGSVNVPFTGTLGTEGIEQTQPGFQTMYTAYEPIVLSQVTIRLRVQTQANSAINTNIRFGVFNATTNTNGGIIPQQTPARSNISVPFTVPARAQSRTFDTTLVIPINVTIPGSTSGFNFFLSPVASTQPAQGRIEWLRSMSTTNPIDDNIVNMSLLAKTGMAGQFQNPQTGTNITGGMFDALTFRGQQKYCDRIELKIAMVCPCNKPTSVTITAPTTSQITICEGSALTLKGTYVDGGKPIVSGINYVWYKLSNQAAIVAGDYKAVPVTDKVFASTVAATDSGKWVLRVEDGTAKTASCYTEDTIHIKIDKAVVAGVISRDTTLCFGVNAPAFTVKTATSGGNGKTPTYQWYQSPKNPVNFTRINGATGATYDPAVLTDTTLFYRKDSSGVCQSKNTNTVQVNMLKELKGGKVGRDTSICTGTAPVAFKEESPATGGDLNYKYQWQSATALAGPYADIASATAKTYASGTLTQTTYFRRVVKTTKPVCTDAYSDTIEVKVISKNDPGAIEKDDSTCSNVVANTITSKTAATGSSTPVYSWVYQELGSTGWTPVSPAVATDTYTPAALTKTTSYRRIAVTGAGTCNRDTTAAVKITVYPVVDAGNIIKDTTVCSGNVPNPFKVGTTAPSGGNGKFTYTWTASATPTGTYTAIPGATGITYTPTAQTVTTTTTIYIKREVKSGNCPAVTNTTPIAYTVLPKVSPGTIGNDTSICQGSAPKKLKEFVAASGGDGNFKYQWKISIDGINYYNIPGAPGVAKELVAVETIDTLTYYRRDVVSGTCDTMSSNVVKVTPIKGFFGGKVIGGNDFCSQVTGITINDDVANPAKPPVGTTPQYFWIYKVGNNGPWQQLAGQTGLSLNMPALQLTDTSYFQRIVVIGPGKCDTSGSNVVTYNIYKQTVPGTILKDTTICAGNNVGVFTINPIEKEGNGIYSYKWQKLVAGTWVDTASTSTIDPPALFSTTQYRRLVSSGKCTDVSDTVTITVNAALTGGAIDSSQNICINTAPTTLFEKTTSTGGGTSTYTYIWQYKTGTGAFTDISSSDAKDYAPGALSVETIYRRLTTFGSCAPAPSNEVTIKILPGIDPGRIGDDQQLCYNTIPVTIQSKALATGALASDIAQYTWEVTSDTTNVPWTDSGIPASTTPDLTPTVPVTTTGFIRRKVEKGSSTCNTAYTKPVKITVFADQTSGAIGSDQTFCQNGTMATLTETTAATGGNTTNPYSYKWISSISSVNGPWVNETVVTSTYPSKTQTDTIYYRRIVESFSPTTTLSCGMDTSNVVTINVRENLPVSVSLPAADKKCIGAPVSFKATPVNEGVAPTYEWFVNGIKVTAANSPVFTSTTLADNDKVSVQLTSDITCTTPGTNPATSAQVTVILTDSITPFVSLNTPAAVCEGTSLSFKATPISGGINPTYEWFEAGNSVSGFTGDIFSSTTIKNAQTVKVILKADTSGLPCYRKDTASATVSLVVYTIPTPDIIQANDTICQDSSLTYVVHNTKGSLQWFKDGSLIVKNSSNPDSVLTITQSGKYYAVESRPNGLCPISSDTIEVKVIPYPIADAGTDQYVLEGDMVTLRGSGGGYYSWTPADSLNDPLIGEPKFIAQENIQFTLVVTDSTRRCATQDNVMIFVERPIIIVNTFSPNGDGVNDGWVIRNIESFPKCIVKIYNRWGSLVWKSNSYPNPWDGTNMYNDQVLPDGTYFYIIELNSTIFKNPYQGWVQIVR